MTTSQIPHTADAAHRTYHVDMDGLTAAAVTVSDGVTNGTREDVSGDVLSDRLESIGLTITRHVVPDEYDQIRDLLVTLAAAYPLIVTTGGTGFGPRDVTPEATSSVIDRPASGLAEHIRAEGLKHTPMAALSRGVSGVVGSCLVVNLPGSPKAVEEGMDAIALLLPHILNLLSGHTEH